MENLKKMIERAEQIVSDQKRTKNQKDIALAGIMTDMEDKYKIPMLQDPAWEEKNPDIIKTYRRISDMRSI